MSNMISRSASYRTSPERLWQALTRPEQLQRWFLQGDLQPVVGHRCRCEGVGASGRQESVECEVLVVEPQRRLAFRCTSMDTGAVSLVSWTIVPRRGRTLLRIEHREVAVDAGAAPGADAGAAAAGAAGAGHDDAGLAAGLQADLAGLDALESLVGSDSVELALAA